MSYTLKDQLALYLELRGMSVSELSRRTRVPKQTLHDWLTGNGAGPRDLRQVRAVAKTLGVSIEHLVFGSKDNPEDRKVTELDALLGNGWISGTFEVRMRRVRRNEE